ncbi:hypothetical protein [Dysosmobacter sp.]|uniref:hypothetical protein n=1 Tax=Dysosmobacter sp. TaxID=2591382 RepID=UPI002D7F570D|nr:hypothetical protein [Dysosmobacter sp.]
METGSTVIPKFKSVRVSTAVEDPVCPAEALLPELPPEQPVTRVRSIAMLNIRLKNLFICYNTFLLFGYPRKNRLFFLAPILPSFPCGWQIAVSSTKLFQIMHIWRKYQ